MVVFGAAAWLVRIPLAYLLGHVILKDADGVWLSQLTSMAVQAALCLLVFQFANWSRFAMSPKKKTGADNGLTVPARHPRVPG
jgi:MATE family multidrug resistance protein